MSTLLSALLWRAVSLGALRSDPGRALLSVLGIALGLALGLAVTLINTAAVNEFSQSVQRLSGEADLVLRGPAFGFSEEIYPLVARDPAVAVASPALELDVALVGRDKSLKILGLDYFRARQLSQPSAPGEGMQDIAAVFDPDAVVLSEAAATWLSVSPGDRLTVQAGLQELDLEVTGILPVEGVSQRLGLMDVAGAQWRFGRLGKLNRIDIRLHPGMDPQAFRVRLQNALPPGLLLERPQAAGDRAAGLSRAYRANLSMLSLVALFTGAFLVFATVTLSVLRRRTQLALLRVLGVTQLGLVRLLLTEAAIIGILGAAIGVSLGWLLASAGMNLLSGELGAGYFQGVSPELHADPTLLMLFFALGVWVALLGAWAPALETARSAPALAIKGGDVERSLGRLQSAWPGFALVTLGVLAALAPSVAGLPLLAYLGVALILFGAVTLMPRLLSEVGAYLPAGAAVPSQIAVLQLRGAPGQAAVAVAAILVSFSLMVAMAIMVSSFRQSVDEWLEQILRADLYLSTAESGSFGLVNQASLERMPGISRVEFFRFQDILLGSNKPPVTLIARPVDRDEPQQALPILGESLILGLGSPPPVWISEAVRDLYGYHPGQRIELPLIGESLQFTVAGVWRDYARQTGAIVVELETYRRLTGDLLIDDAALWLPAGAAPQRVVDALRARLPGGDKLEVRAPAEIRRLSLEAFDRSFAVTYLLEIVAVLIGLFAISSSFNARVLSRQGEFAMLRHLGMNRTGVAVMLGLEATIIAGVGAGAGLVVGWVISLILVFVINPQSFHWSMDLHLPWEILAGLALLLILAAGLTAAWSARHATGPDIIRAIREE